MARLPRLSLVDGPVHGVQRGNDRQVCFAAEEDYSAYVSRLSKYSEKYGVDVNVWVFMTSRFRLLGAVRRGGSMNTMMQSMGRNYGRYCNREYQRTGNVWKGHYRSCLVAEDRYLLEVYRYIEPNPVWAERVKGNGLGKPFEVYTPHSEYQAMH